MLNYLLNKNKEYTNAKIQLINANKGFIDMELDFKGTYLDRVLDKYSSLFDIKKPYEINGREFSAYGYFYSLNEKYVLTRKANLWRAKAYEHILFLEVDKCDSSLIEEMKTFIRDYMEPVMARNGEKYPPEDHMYTYLSIVVISKERPDKDVIRAVRRFNYDKGYLFSFRGHSEAHVICVDMESESVYTNLAARDSKKLFLETLREFEKDRIFKAAVS